MRGSFTCASHGSATKAARAWAEYRLWHERLDREFLRAFAAFNERCKAREAAARRAT